MPPLNIKHQLKITTKTKKIFVQISILKTKNNKKNPTLTQTQPKNFKNTININNIKTINKVKITIII